MIARLIQVVMILTLVSFFFLNNSCKHSYHNSISNDCVENIYNKKDSVLAYFKGMTLLTRGEEKNDFGLQVYNNNGYKQFHFHKSKNSNSFELVGPQFYVLRDSTNMLQISDSEKVKIIESFNRQIDYMNSLNIKSINSDFSQLGITLEIFACDGSEIVYLTDRLNVNNTEWLKYINSLKTIDAHWYYK